MGGRSRPGTPPVIEPASGPYAWLRRYSGLFGLLSVLLLAIVAGLLVGHWVTQSKAPSQQVLRVEGLSAAARRHSARVRGEPDRDEHDRGNRRSSPPAGVEQSSGQDRSARSARKPRRSKKRRPPRRSQLLRPNFRNSATRTAASTRKKSTSSAPSRSKRAADGDAHRCCPRPTCAAAATSWPSASPR